MSDAGVLGGALLAHLHRHGKFLGECRLFLLKFFRGAKRLLHEPGIGDDLLALRHQFVECRDEGRLDLVLRHMRRLAFMPVVLVVATVDDPAVLVGAMPDLGIVKNFVFLV